MITLGWALAVYVAVLITGPYSDAHINPALSIGLSVASKFSWESLPSYISSDAWIYDRIFICLVIL